MEREEGIVRQSSVVVVFSSGYPVGALPRPTAGPGPGAAASSARNGGTLQAHGFSFATWILRLPDLNLAPRSFSESRYFRNLIRRYSQVWNTLRITK
jgi:hypothetical protein